MNKLVEAIPEETITGFQLKDIDGAWQLRRQIHQRAQLVLLPACKYQGMHLCQATGTC